VFKTRKSSLPVWQKQDTYKVIQTFTVMSVCRVWFPEIKCGMQLEVQINVLIRLFIQIKLRDVLELYKTFTNQREMCVEIWRVEYNNEVRAVTWLRTATEKNVAFRRVAYRLCHYCFCIFPIYWYHISLHLPRQDDMKIFRSLLTICVMFVGWWQFVANFPKMKVGLLTHHSVCVCLWVSL
jgi:hypothetical protein